MTVWHILRNFQVVRASPKQHGPEHQKRRIKTRSKRKKGAKTKEKEQWASQITRMQGATELVLRTQLTKESKCPPPKDQTCAERRGRVHLPPVWHRSQSRLQRLKAPIRHKHKTVRCNASQTSGANWVRAPNDFESVVSWSLSISCSLTAKQTFKVRQTATAGTFANAIGSECFSRKRKHAATSHTSLLQNAQTTDFCEQDQNQWAWWGFLPRFPLFWKELGEDCEHGSSALINESDIIWPLSALMSCRVLQKQKQKKI